MTEIEEPVTENFSVPREGMRHVYLVFHSGKARPAFDFGRTFRQFSEYNGNGTLDSFPAVKDSVAL